MREFICAIFYITAALYVCGAIVYTIFASGVEQEWAKDTNDDPQSHQTIYEHEVQSDGVMKEKKGGGLDYMIFVKSGHDNKSI